MNKNEQFVRLLNDYLSAKLSIADQEKFFQLLASNEFDHLLSESILEDLHKGFEQQSADLPPHIAQEIVRNIYHSEKHTAKILPINKRFNRWNWIAAASVILVAISAIWFLMLKPKNIQEQFAAIIPPTTIAQKNLSEQPRHLVLSDGSTVTLKPNSVLHYPDKFSDSSREVYLEGEAFFEVAKNPQKPFLVYYNNIVTKVLGTSFTINTNNKSGNIEVAVKTGRVQVYENVKVVKEKSLASSVIVTPNQKAIYLVGKRILETSIVDIPEPVYLTKSTAVEEKAPSFIYEQVRLDTILKELQKVYGIEIIVENANLNNCLFTGDVSARDLFAKLRVICLATGSTFEVNTTKILIKGVGCS
jgi:hypothetical protein